MARVDKTQSAIGVVRGVLAADISSANFDHVIGVGLDSAGKIVVGGGNSGIVGVMVPSTTAYKAGDPADIFVLADIVDVTDPALPAGTKIYANTTTGVIGTSGTGASYIGFTVEATRLIIRL